jgi:fucose 4-O-acetylase-like acetyltransferase
MRRFSSTAMTPRTDGVGDGAARPSGRAERVAWFDNAKFLLMVAVVLGHTVETGIASSPGLRALYIFLYAFHMPLFAFLCGRFSHATMTAERRARLIEGILVPYFVFEVLYSLFDYFALGGAQLSFTLATPNWLMWFLLSLFFWRVMLPYFVELRCATAAAFGLGVVAGYIPHVGYFLSVSRTLVFFPFFFLGYQLRRESFAWLTRPATRAAAAGVLVAGYLVAWQFGDGVSVRFLYGSYSHLSLGLHHWAVGGWRLLAYAAALVLGTAFLALVPRRHVAFTALGAYSLYPYLLHGFVVKYARAAGWVSQALASVAGQVTVGVAAAALTVLLSLPPVRRLVRPLLEPRLTFLFHGRPTASPGQAG